LTFFWTTRVVPLIYDLYQLLVSFQRRTAPRFVLLKLLIDPLNRTSASVAAEPSTALKIPLPLDTCPELLTIEKTLAVLASPAQVWPSEAVPQSA
jgi:hypothetical protein